MLFHPRLNPPSWYRPVYLVLSTVLGVLVSSILHAVIEIWWLRYAQDHDLPITWTMFFGIGSCALPPVVQYGLLILGLLGGYFVGRVWWRWVYIERRWWKEVK